MTNSEPNEKPRPYLGIVITFYGIAVVFALLTLQAVIEARYGNTLLFAGVSINAILGALDPGFLMQRIDQGNLFKPVKRAPVKDRIAAPGRGLLGGGVGVIVTTEFILVYNLADWVLNDQLGLSTAIADFLLRERDAAITASLGGRGGGSETRDSSGGGTGRGYFGMSGTYERLPRGTVTICMSGSACFIPPLLE